MLMCMKIAQEQHLMSLLCSVYVKVSHQDPMVTSTAQEVKGHHVQHFSTHSLDLYQLPCGTCDHDIFERQLPGRQCCVQWLRLPLNA